ncbi:MAG: PAS domain-containing protein [Candidatus Zixiibacteriota bacterium]|nr:MAG: PAS domain-containing protein [candidate division Zixibacteria bacterium]
MDEKSKFADEPGSAVTEVSRFADSYASFSRIVNSLQRKYIELKEEFGAQNEELVQANQKLVALTRKNIAATEFLKGILNSISAGVIAIDLNGRITHFNPAASIILGIPVGEPLGKPYRDIIPPGTPVAANAVRAAESGREVDSVEKQIELPDGGSLQVSVSTAVLRDSDGRPTGAVEVFQDLTKFKKMEQEIARLNTLAALGEMAATVAHEVRNPLSGIGGFAALLLRDLDDNDPRRELVEKITRGVDSLNETVETLLSYSRFEEVNKTEVDLEEYVKGTVEQFRLDHESRLENMTIDYRPTARPGAESTRVCVDKMLFRQVIVNILSNAVEACDGWGEIEMRSRQLPRQTAVAKYNDRMLLGIRETVVEVTISDNGCGFEAGQLDRIFSPFFSTKQGGNGLGLAIAWKIMKAHGGEIIAEDNKDQKGATFRLLMPVPVGGGCPE